MKSDSKGFMISFIFFHEKGHLESVSLKGQYIRNIFCFSGLGKQLYRIYDTRLAAIRHLQVNFDVGLASFWLFYGKTFLFRGYLFNVI